MPYNNSLNRDIAKQLREINERFINHTPNSYDVAESKVGTANKRLVDETNIGQEEGHLKTLEGGAYSARGGFAKGTFRDTGFGSVLGAGKYMNNEVVYENNENNVHGGNFLSDFVSGVKKGFKSVVGPASAILGMVPLPQAQIASKALGIAGDLAGKGARKQRKPRAKKEKANKNKKVADKVKKEEVLLLKRSMDVGSPNKKHIGIMSKLENVILDSKPVKKRGRPNKMKGGAESLAKPYNMVNANGITGSGKKRIIGGVKKVKRNVNESIKDGHKLTPVAQMQSSGMSGQGKTEKRSDVVKRIMKERGVNMIKASQIVKAEKLY